MSSIEQDRDYNDIAVATVYECIKAILGAYPKKDRDSVLRELIRWNDWKKQ